MLPAPDITVRRGLFAASVIRPWYVLYIYYTPGVSFS
jgi:hypothetical protein